MPNAFLPRPAVLVRVSVGVAMLVAALAVTPTAATAASTPASTAVVDSCDQTPAAGHYTCFAQRLADPSAVRAMAASSDGATPRGYGPADLQSAYALEAQAASGTSQRVYVVDAYDDPTAEADLATYRAQYGLPACTTANGCFVKLNQSGQPSPLPAVNRGWASEISLDLDMVSAICPNCGITLIESRDASDNLFAAVKEATNLGAKFVSMSWGGSEGGDPAYDSAYFQPTGVVYAAATGDDAYAAGVNYPASSPDVVAVGGTSLTRSTSARGWSETAWHNAYGGAGSGCSRDEPRPWWQTSQIVPIVTCVNRAVADVSAVADPATGVAVYDTTGVAAGATGWAVYGGTSAATPIIAAIYALAGTPVPAEVPAALPYLNAGNLNDVTSGSTGTCSSAAALCTARRGWDGPTGLGTPIGTSAFTPAEAPPRGNIVTVSNPGSARGTVARATALQIRARDSASARLTYTAAGLPPGLSIVSTTGLIRGTPTRAGTYRTTVVVTDSTGVGAGVVFTWTIAPAVCAGNLVSNPGFESGSAGWSQSATLVHRSPTYAYQGTHLAKLDGWGHTHHDRLARTITIPAGCHAQLHFHLRVLTNDRSKVAHDHLYLSLASRRIAAYSNLNRSSGYRFATFNISRYAGSRITIAWNGYENRTFATSFLVDYVGVTLTK